MSDEFTWTDHTQPFEALDGSPARFVLEQVDDGEFRVRAAFRYRQPDGATIEVDDSSLGRTDLASIPAVMAWFVSRHGRHTPAALVHDQLVGSNTSLATRAAADRTFLEAMDAIGVPPVRSHMMWAAVSLATRWQGGLRARAGLILWVLASMAGTVLLVAGIVTRTPLEILLALVLPVPAGALWGRQFWAGVISGFAIWFVVLPAVASWIGYGCYRIAEEVVRYARKVLPSNRGESVPTPVSYREA